MDTKVCHKCLVEKPLEEFPWKNIVTHKRQAVCKTCTAQRSAAWYENNKQHHVENVMDRKRRLRDEARDYVWNYLLSHPCENCGESDPIVLEFHHTGSKESNVSELIYRADSILQVVQEISRCQVLCGNCHKRVTAKERGWYRNNK
jgi:hypothetical protein